MMLNQSSIKTLAFKDSKYPPLLREIYDPPKSLYVTGNLEILSGRALAIVGSRKATPYGLTIARRFAKALAGYGFVIVSGLALGIDQAAHEGALDAAGATTAVLGSGLNHIYPARNKGLAGKIVGAGGALVSEFAAHMPPLAYHFPRRNRIISGLSLGVLIVEAARQSGSLITARLALEQNRDVFAIPHALSNPRGAGCLLLLSAGAMLVQTPADIAEFYDTAVPFGEEASTEAQPPLLESTQQKLLECIGHEATSFDVIAAHSGLSASEIHHLLIELELQGCIVKRLNGYQRVN